MGRVVVVEVLGEGLEQARVGSAAAQRVPCGLCRHAAMVTQLGDRQSLLVAVFALIIVYHVVPIIGSLFKVDMNGHVALVIFHCHRLLACAMLGKLVIVHVLGHRKRAAAHRIVARIGGEGAIEAEV